MAQTVEAARVIINIKTNGDKAAKEVKQVDNSFMQFAKSAAFVAIGKAVFDIGKQLVNLASDAEETQNKFNVTFSNIQKQADGFAKNLAESYGLSSNASKKLLSDTGDLLTGFGFSQESALGLSNEVNKLAVDLASFTNFSGGAEGASQALTKALLGERESMKALGIAITEADIKQLAEEKGIVGELDRQTKAMLTLELATSQSKNAIGDFARSQDSFANQSRVTNALMEDIGVILGQTLLPFVTDVTKGFNDFLRSIKGVAEEGGGPLQQFVAIIEVLKGAFKPLVETIGPAVQGIMDTIGEEFGEAAEEGDLGQKAMQALAQVGQVLAAVFRVVAVSVQAIIKNIANMVKIVTASVDVFENFWKAITGEGSWEDVGKSIQNVGGNFQEFLVDGVEGMADVAKTAMDEFMGLGEGIQNTTLELTSIYDNAMSDMEDRTKEAADNINDTLGGGDGGGGIANPEGVIAEREKFNNRINEMLFEQHATELEMIEAKMAEELAMAEKLGADKTAVEKFYLEEIDRLRQEQSDKETERMREQIQMGIDLVNSFGNAFLRVSSNIENAELERMKAQGASEEELDAKKAQIARDSAIRERDLGLALVAINTAVAVAEALPNIPLAIFAGAEGALQAAVIASTPIPAAQFGGSFEVAPGNPADSGLLRVNEGERVTVDSVRDSGGSGMMGPVILKIGNEQAEGIFERGTQRALDSGNVKINRPEIIGRNRI